MDPPTVSPLLTPAVPSFLTTLPPPTSPTATGPSLLPSLRASLKANFPTAPSIPTATPTRIETITSLPHLQRAILTARAHSRQVLPYTPAHPTSLSPRAHAHLARGGLLLDLSPLRALSLHPRRAVVIAQAGVTLRDLARLLDAHLSWSHRVQLPHADHAAASSCTVASAVANGALAVDGLLADAVREISVVDASGRLRVYSHRDPLGLFHAVKLSLGLFGVIYDVTLAVDGFRRVVTVSNRFVTMPALQSPNFTHLLRRRVAARDAVQIVWYPFNSYQPEARELWDPCHDLVWIRTLERIVEPPDAPPLRLRADQDVAYNILTIPQWFSRNASRLAEHGYAEYKPVHAKLFLALGFQQTAWKLETDPFPQMLAHAVQYHDNADAFPVHAVAVAFPLRLARDEDWDTLHEAWQIVTEKVKQCDQLGQYPLNVSLKTSFVKSSDALLASNFANSAPGKKNSYSAVVQICSALHTEGWVPFAKHVVTEWMRLPGARCRLSRDLVGVCDPDTVIASLGDSLQDFAALRRNAGVDDNGMFLDESLAELLGMSGHRSDFSSSPVSSSGSALSLARNKDMESLLTRGQKSDGSTPDRDVANAESSASHRDGVISTTGSAGVSQSSLPWTPQTSTAQLIPSPGASRHSLFEENDFFTERNHDRDDPKAQYHVDDDESLASDFSGEYLVPQPLVRKIPPRRRRAVKYQTPLTSPEFCLLLAYVALYALLWFAMFGPSALRHLGWFLQAEP